VQLNGLIAVGHHAKPLPSPCLREVYPNGTGWVRQFRCLNRVVWRVLRGSYAQV
jgi:hypothetical protein